VPLCRARQPSGLHARGAAHDSPLRRRSPETPTFPPRTSTRWGPVRLAEGADFFAAASGRPRARLRQPSLPAWSAASRRPERSQCLVTAIRELEHGVAGESICPGRRDQPHAKRELPRRTGARLVDVELPADQLQPRGAPADLREQLVEAQQLAIAPRGDVVLFPWPGHRDAGHYPPTRRRSSVSRQRRPQFAGPRPVSPSSRSRSGAAGRSARGDSGSGCGTCPTPSSRPRDRRSAR
jgi:hypothetical protein